MAVRLPSYENETFSKEILPIRRPGSIASAESRMSGFVSSTSKKSRSFGASIASLLIKDTTCSSLPMINPAKAIKVTISPTVMRFMVNSQAPSTTMHRIVSVVAERVSIVMTAHHDRTGSWALSTRWLIPLRLSTSCCTRAKLCTNATLPKVSDARSAKSE